MVSDSSEHPIRAVMVAMMMIMMMEREAHAPAHEGAMIIPGPAEHEGKNEEDSEQPEHCGFLLSGGQRAQKTCTQIVDASLAFSFPPDAPASADGPETTRLSAFGYSLATG